VGLPFSDFSRMYAAAQHQATERRDSAAARLYR
jgi:hypothetical protein